MNLPAHLFVVVDMHLLRDLETVGPLVEEHRRSGQGVLVCWRQAFELAKSEKGALSTFRQSFQHFRDTPEMLAMSWPAYTLARRERERGWFRPRLADMVDPTNTRDLREMVVDLRHWSPAKDRKIGAALMRVREGSEQILAQEADADVMRKMTAAIKKAVDRGSANAIRKGIEAGDRTPFRTELGKICSAAGLYTMLRDLHFTRGRAFRRSVEPSLAAVKGIVHWANALHWRCMNGIETQSEAQLVNDASDIEYCTIALYGRGYFTRETKWLELYGDCQAVCHHLWSVVTPPMVARVMAPNGEASP